MNGNPSELSPRNHDSDLLEVNAALQQLSEMLQNIVVRGLRICGQQELGPLRSQQSELARIGAHHLERRLQTLINAIESDLPDASAELLRTQAVLRVFERVLTLQYAKQLLSDEVAVR